MTKLQKLALEANAKRKRLAELVDKDSKTMSAEEKTEMNALADRLQEIEFEIRAVAAAESQTDPLDVGAVEDSESVELRALIARANVGDVFAAVIEQQTTEGATRELQQHYGMKANQVPLAMLRERDPVRAAVTPAPKNVQGNQQPIIPAVFPRSVSAFLGVDMPTVGVGEAIFPILTTSAAPGTPAKGASQAETTGAFSAEALKPGRIQASFFYAREDAAMFAGMAEALRMNLTEALADKLDAEIIAGANGLLTGTNLANNNVTAQTTYALYRSQLAYGRVDGEYAGDVSDVRIVMSSGSYGHCAEQFRSENAGDRSAIEDLEQATGGVRVSKHVPAPDSANKRANAIVRLGMRRDMVAPIWEGINLITDEATKAATGEIVITAVMLHAVQILRAAGFHKQGLQHKA